MRVLVLTWSRPSQGPAPQAAGLAAALQRAGDDVRLLTRLDGTGPATTHAEPGPGGSRTASFRDVPPVLPDVGLVPLLSDASRAATVGTRLLVDERADVVHADGWHAVPAALALRTALGVDVVTVLPDGPGPDASDLPAAAGDELLAAAEAAGPVLRRAVVPGDAVLPWGVDLPVRPPRRPPGAGGVRLVPAPDEPARRAAATVRARLSAPHRVGTSTRRRPAVVAVADPDDAGAALAGMASGVPVVAVAGGTAATLVTRSGGGLVADREDLPETVDRLLTTPELAAALGAAGHAHATAHHDWDTVVATWRRAVGAGRGARSLAVAEATGR